MIELYKYTDKEQKELLKSMTILVDTREKDGHNDHILNWFDAKKIPWRKKKLDYGDYSVLIPANEALDIPRDLDFSSKIIVERKANLDEFATNVSSERDRIKKELALAPENKILIIENGSYADMVNGKYRSQYSAQSYVGTFHSFWHEFNIPIIFMPDNAYTGQFIVYYFYYYLRNIIK